MLNREQTLELSRIVREKMQAGNDLMEIRGVLGEWHYAVTFNPSTIKLQYGGYNGWNIDTGMSAACLAFSPEYAVNYFGWLRERMENALK